MSSKPREGRQPRAPVKKKRLCIDDEAVVGRTGEADQNGTDRTDPQHPPCGRQAEAEVDQEPAAEACVAALALHVLD